MTQDDSTTDRGSLDHLGADRRERAASGLMAVACLLLLAGAGLLVLMLIKLAIPTLFADSQFLAYGRLRPAAMLMLVYGFGGTLTQAVAYYLIPRLVGARMPRQREALLGGIAYAGLVTLGALAVLFRGPSGPELAEFPPIIDWLIAALLLLPPFLVTSMLRHRTEEGAFVSTLYVLGAVWWYPALHITGSIPGLQGVGPFLQAGLVANGLLWLAFPAAALGAAYYVLVKESGRPLFSGPLARAGFWTLAGTALLATPTRFLGGPAPGWTETVAAAAAMGLMIAALAVMTNLGQTLSGDWETARRSVVIRYLMVGATAYTLVTVLTGLSGFRSVAAVVGLTTWHEGLIIGTALVAVPALGMAFVLHAFPRTTGRDLASEAPAERGLRLLTWGGGITAGAFVVAGLVSGITWNWASASGSRLNAGAGFADTFAEVDVMFTLGALASVVALVGIALMVWTALGTYVSGTARPVEMLVPVEPRDDE
ncbi:MAG: cbb3-type cytochrome c oxidase subunit I [bacterium]|nr:cbb3-type cytochrome c oxidase subunit I [bacterium]MDE0353327.1 cbb3-type cytochrome c oxidase subunit I [bacterium]